MKISNFIRTLTRRYKLEKVFTPGTAATLTYVKRETLERDVIKFVKTPGIQLILYGYSGCGKSTLVINILTKLKIKYIVSRCTSKTTFNDLVLSAFDKLGVFYKSKKSKKKNAKIYGGISANKGHGPNINSSLSYEEMSSEIRVAQFQTSPERLAESFGAENSIWIIEDFHKVDNKEKKLIADVMKIFSDTANQYPVTKIICIGAVATARELIELDSNLSDRVAQIRVPLLTEEQILDIISIGLSLLNQYMTKKFKEQIAYYSNNLAMICHQLCLDICHSKKIYRTQFRKVSFDNTDFKKAVLSHMKQKSDTLKSLYNKITSSRIRKQVLKAFINTDNEFLTIDEIYNEIIHNFTDITSENTQKQIEQMISPKYEEVLRIENYTMKISFSNPFFKSYVRMSLDIENMEKQNRQNRRKQKYAFEPDEQENILDRLNKYKPSSSLEDFNKYIDLQYRKAISYPTKIDTILYPIEQVPVIDTNKQIFKVKKRLNTGSNIRAIKRNKTFPRNRKR